MSNWEKSLAPHSALLEHLRRYHSNQWVGFDLVGRMMGWSSQYVEEIATNLADSDSINIIFVEDTMLYTPIEHDKKRLDSLIDRIKKKLGT